MQAGTTIACGPGSSRVPFMLHCTTHGRSDRVQIVIRNDGMAGKDKVVGDERRQGCVSVEAKLVRALARRTDALHHGHFGHASAITQPPIALQAPASSSPICHPDAALVRARWPQSSHSINKQRCATCSAASVAPTEPRLAGACCLRFGSGREITMSSMLRITLSPVQVGFRCL